MVKRSPADLNQAELAEAINWFPGCTFIDTHDVPRNLPELTGFPDGLIVCANAVTVLCDDPQQVRAVLSVLANVRIIDGGLILVEIKTPKGKLRPDQVAWWERYGLIPRILRTVDDVLTLLSKL